RGHHQSDQPPPPLLGGSPPDQQGAPVGHQQGQDVPHRAEQPLDGDLEEVSERPALTEPQPEGGECPQDEHADPDGIECPRREMPGEPGSGGADPAGTAAPCSGDRCPPPGAASILPARPPRSPCLRPGGRHGQTSMITGTITGLRCVTSKKYLPSAER